MRYDNERLMFGVIFVAVLVMVNVPIVLFFNQYDPCDESSWEAYDIVSLREEKVSWYRKYYYATLNNSVEYEIDREMFLELAVNMTVEVSNCGTIKY